MIRATRSVVLFACIFMVLSVYGFSQSGTMSTFPGLNTVQDKLAPTAAPDVTIAVGLFEYCEHVNNAYQCWYKGGTNANQPVKFLGNTTPKLDSGPWSQNSDNGGNTSHCPTANSPNSQLLHDNVYNLWILEKRITAPSNGHNYMCVAISNVEDVSSTSPAFSWFAFEYDLDTVIPQDAEGNYYYPDYPQSGLWQTSSSTAPPYTAASDQALWITYDLQDVDDVYNIWGVLICAVDLAGLRASTSSPWVNNSQTPACLVAQPPLANFDQRRSWVPANNSDTTPPISADGEMFTYMVEPPMNHTSYLTNLTDTQEVEQWTIDWTSATPSPTYLNTWDLPSTQAAGDQMGCFTAANYYDTVCIPQPSTVTTGIYIDSVADRMQQFFHYTSNGGQGSVWTSSHAIQITPSATVLSQTEADIRLLQRNTAAPNAVYVAEDYQILDPVDSNAYVFLPSVARDQVGNLQGILGISGTASNEHPGLDSLYYDPTTQQEGTYGYIASPVTDGDAEDTDRLGYRWGDWQSAVLDPSDSCTVWVAGEFLPTDRTTEPFWYTELAKLPPMNTCTGAPVTLSSVSLSFGNQQVGVSSAPLVETVTNQQTVPLNISAIYAGGAFTQTNTCQAPVPAGGNCTISVTFTPSSTGTATGTLNIDDGASNSPQVVSLQGTGIPSSILLAPTALAFGSQVINTTSAAGTITVTNQGSSNVTVNSVLASGGYSETDTCTGVTLTAGKTCKITVTFTPTVIGSMPGTITVNDTSVGAPHIATLTGNGQYPVSLSADLAFGTVDVGSSSAPQTITFTNNQSQGLTFTYATSGDYSAVGSGTNPCGSSLAAKAQCTLAVTFTPTFNGLIRGALTINYNAAGSPATRSFTGTGQDGEAVPLTFTPAALAFGNVVLNTTSSKTVTMKNIGTTTVTVNSVTGSGYFAATPSGTAPCGGALAAGKQCTFTVQFTPLEVGSSDGGVTVIDNAGVNTQVQDVTGAGVLPVTLSPTSISFGTVTVGNSSAVQVVTVSNNQSTAIAINSVVASGDFVATSGGASPCSGSVPANGTCTLGVQFSPTVTGAIGGELTVSYTGFSPQVVSLSGTGD
jgi:hypothetical protein